MADGRALSGSKCQPGCLGLGMAMEAFDEAKRAGKIRLVGFSAPSLEAALALMERRDFDTILFPVNYATWHAGEARLAPGPVHPHPAQKRRTNPRVVQSSSLSNSITSTISG
jgi:hypothetical protein